MYTTELIEFDLTDRLIRRFPLIKCINRGSEAGESHLAALRRPTIYHFRVSTEVNVGSDVSPVRYCNSISSCFFLNFKMKILIKTTLGK